MEIDKQEMVHFAQWMDDAARTIEKWAEHAPEYFKKKGRLVPDICRFDDRAQYIRDMLAAARDTTVAPAQTARQIYDRERAQAAKAARVAAPAAPNDNTEKEACVHFTGHTMFDEATPPPQSVDK